MTATTAVQGALVQLNADLCAVDDWDRGIGVWSIVPENDGTVALHKLGGDGWYTEVNLPDVVEALRPPLPQHLGWVISFDCWLSDQGGDQTAADADDRVDARFLVAGLRNGTCVVLEQRRDRPKPRMTLDTGGAPPIGMIPIMCEHMRSRILPPPMPPEIASMIQAMGGDPAQAHYFEIPLPPEQS